MSFKKFLILFILAFAIGFLIFYYISLKINLIKAPTPWVLITLMIFPAGYCIQALFKLPESNEHPSLRSSELRRLKPIIAMKSRHLVALFAYYLLCSLVIALGFYAIPNSHKYYNYFVSLSGGMIVSCLTSFMYIKSIMDEIQSFKSFLIHRSESDKIRKEIMESGKKEAE